jgi:4-hydroxy-2,2'-bipyrrole-5-carbaldehyde O-methyltransferase
MRDIRTRGVLATLRGGHAAARALAVGDSRTFVRAMFLASAVRLDVLPELRTPRSLADLTDVTGATRPERLEAWLDVGVATGELGRRDGRYAVRGRRARALADEDAVLTAHYRSLLDYQAGVYADLADRLRDPPGGGRPDLEEHAAVIAQVSRVAAPFVVPYLDDAVAELRPARVLDIGCGTGVYVRALLEADPGVEVDGIDVAADVVARGDADLQAAGLDTRARLHVGDIRDWPAEPDRRFGLITLINDIYYFASSERPALYERLATLLEPAGQLLVVTETRFGSVASAHLHLLLACQAGAASLPTGAELDADLRQAGFEIVDRHPLVPTEPFVGIRARPGTSSAA